MPTTKSNPSCQSLEKTLPPAIEVQDPGSHAYMHQEHGAWMSDIANWRDDLVEWERETRKVLAELKQLESLLQQHDLTLVAHSEQLLTHRRKMVNHEHSLAEFERGGSAEDLIHGSMEHRQERETHLAGQNCHEALKHRHRMIVARWQEMNKEIAHLPKP